MMWGFWGNSAWGALGPLTMLLFWLLILGGIALVLRSLWGPGRTSHTDTALALLDERYARGEISREEYLRMRQDLTDRSR